MAAIAGLLAMKGPNVSSELTLLKEFGLIEVEAGDVVPILGRIESIHKQDGRWVVTTSKGIITAPR